MKPGYLSRINRWLSQPDSTTAQLFDQAKAHGALAERVQRCLPEDMRRFCQFTHLSGDSVLLDCASAAWATRVRYSAPQLTKQLSQELGLCIANIKVRVRPKSTSAEPTPTRKTLSTTAQQSLETCARGIQDAELSAALLRLASRGKR